MAQPTTLPFSKFKVLLGDGGAPETFNWPCGFIKNALKLSAQSSDTIVPDCDDPMAAAWTQRFVSALSGSITGNGVMAMESLSIWRQWFASGQSKNIRIVIDLPGAQGGGYWYGAAILTDFSADSDRKSEGGRTQQSVTIDNDGPWLWQDAA